MAFDLPIEKTLLFDAKLRKPFSNKDLLGAVSTCLGIDLTSQDWLQDDYSKKSSSARGLERDRQFFVA
jgi:hypothetical protein